MGARNRLGRLCTALVVVGAGALVLTGVSPAVVAPANWPPKGPWPENWNDYTRAQVKEMAHYAGFRNAAVVYMKAGHLDIRFDPGGFKGSVHKDGAWRTTTYVASYEIEVRVVRGCVAYGTTLDIAFHGYKHETTTPNTENGHVFGLPPVTYQDRRSHLCLGSVYRVTARQVPGWTTDLIDKFHIQPLTFRSTDITIHNSGDVHIPLPPQGG